MTNNAIRYTPNGSQIDLSAEELSDKILICIEDNGNGIPKSERKRVLNPFYRILGSGEVGTGLGLSIAETIAKRYGGSIALKESVNFETGLRVEITFPKAA
ncbi:sensor histidine kinase [Kingella negevensis]|uniref:sensor histidine kinase n=1 Tax=Kingella negevensis TaxID=1522312 RepID=UPI002151ACBD|nr:sensor histidine kinase [Kingella negevensis]MDK4680977.1 sensor histidine kinase [Kingella negevensis]MDK4683179.1 sensor histidine kinase [Kingella negevensis]MDK4688036.1 sensor histidine kinase [Kingella negevensis]MDK4691689.1 sensor histidine kinase [Kingella negevensis]MDK4693159.1 sensor histidine kinase [Kingella negevensis]